MSLVTELADRAHAVAEGAVPDAVLAATRDHLTDSVGALLAGHHTLRGAVERLCDGLYPAGATEGPAGMRRTAFVAGVYTHCWESSDIHRATVLCPGCVILPAFLAALEQRPDTTWDRLLRAYLAGYEVALGAGTLIGSGALLKQGWWPTALVAPLGAAAAATLLLGRPAAVTASAIALAAQHAGGSVAGDSADADGRYLLSGLAAERAVSAVLAADAGFRGPLDILDDARSPLRRRTGNPLLSAGFLLPQTSLKPYTCAQHLQAAVDAVLELRTAPPALNADDIIALDCRLPAQLVPIVDRRPPFRSALSTLASAPFVLAVALLRGRCTPDDYGAGSLADPAVLGLAARINVEADDELTAGYPDTWGAHVTVTSSTGTATARRTTSPGDPGFELTGAEVAAKFRTLAGPALGTRRAADLADLLLAQDPADRAWPLTTHVLPLLHSNGPVRKEIR